MSAASPDWLGVARGAAAELREVLAARPDDRAARAGDRHARRGRRPDARDRRGGGGTRSSAGSRRCTREGHALHRDQRGARARRLRRRRDARRHRPARRLQERQARACPTTRSRSRSPTARRWPTSCSASCTTSGRARSGWRTAGGGAFLDGERLDPGVPERRTRGRLEMVGVESADPRWMRDVGGRARRPRAPRARARRDGGDALPGRGGAARRDDDAAALPRGRRRGGAADRPRGRRPRRLPGRADAARRAARRDGAGLRARRRALARGARGAGRASRASEGRAASAGPCHPLQMVDWQLAAKIAEGVAALQPSGDPEPFQALVRPADESERLVSAVHGAQAARGRAARRRGGEPQRVDRGEPATRCAT